MKRRKEHHLHAISTVVGLAAILVADAYRRDPHTGSVLGVLLAAGALVALLCYFLG